MRRPTRRGRAESRWDVACRAGLILLFAAGCAGSIGATAAEWRIHRADADLATMDRDPDARLPIPDVTRSWPPRAAMSEALAQARVAASETAPQARDERLAAASALLADAQKGRPHWPLTRLVDSYIQSVRSGPGSPAAITAYQASYSGGAFLREAAPWRIRYGLDHWAALDPATRQHVVDEAAWYSTVRGGYVETMTAIAGQPAEIGVMRERADLLRASQQSKPAS